MAEIDELRRRAAEDEALLRRAEAALTEVKVAQGLSEQHASVLAALRIRLKGDAGRSLEDVLSAAGDVGGPDLGEMMARPDRPKRSLDDLLGGAGPGEPDRPVE